MLFSSISFLLLFLPVVLILYFGLFRILGRTASNLFLLAASLFFYGWGEPYFICILMLSIVFNYGMAVCVEKAMKYRKVLLWFSIIINLLTFFIFKYLNFLLENLMKLGWKIDIPDVVREITMPIGISFYTFQALSYIIDVYRGGVKAKRNPLDVGLYISFFPQLIAGPIVRYSTIAEQIKSRAETWDKVGEGISRFVIGLSKKVILSNSFALIADECFANFEWGVISVTWIGVLSYTLQIYYDFSGYSDMAIGLGKIFGFEFLENFNYPYYADSISDFWRRWHISLGSFFREYIYIPLGGSKVGRKRLIRNLFIVWLLTGLWHGANWTFVLWGLMYFVLIAIEKHWAGRTKGHKMIGHLYTIFWVMIGWVFFRSNTVGDALKYIGVMLGIGAEKIFDVRSAVLMQENRVLFLIGIIGCFPVVPYIKRKWSKYEVALDSIKAMAIPLLFFVCCCYLVKSTYNPFIYFNF